MLRAAALLLAATISAQAPYPHLVLIAQPGGNPAARILEVDTTTGAQTTLGRFPADTLPPLAIALDPFDRHVLVACDLGTGSSRIVRLERTGTGLAQHAMLDVSGSVTALTVSDDAVLIASDGGGGLLRAPRRGGPALLVFAQANLTAMHGFGPNSAALLLAWTGRPGSASTASGTALVDAVTGALFLGPDTFPNPTGVELTGAVDLPTGVPRQLLAFADGSYALFAGSIGPPQPLNPTITIPPGGAVAMAPASAFSTTPMALGGISYPNLYTIDAFTGTVNVLAGPLPGTPVDFCSGGERTAQGFLFTNRCGPQPLFQGWSGLQQPGSTFTINIQGQPNGFALLAVGLRDLPGLPFALPGGCTVDVAPDATLLHLLDAAGASNQPIAVPGGPGLLGLILFSQWLHYGAAGYSTSAAAAHQIGL